RFRPRPSTCGIGGQQHILIRDRRRNCRSPPCRLARIFLASRNILSRLDIYRRYYKGRREAVAAVPRKILPSCTVDRTDRRTLSSLLQRGQTAPVAGKSRRELQEVARLPRRAGRQARAKQVLRFAKIAPYPPA